MKATKSTTPAPVVLWTNENSIRDMEAKLNGLLPLAAKLVTEYQKLPFSKPEATIGHILAQSGNEAREHHLSLIPDTIEAGTLRLNKEAAIKSGLFAEPTFPEFEQVLNNCKETDLQQLSPFFKIGDGLCILNASTWDLFVEQHSIVAKTPGELEMYEKWQNMLTATMELDKFLRKNADLILLNGVSITQFNRLAMPDINGGIKINALVFEALAKKLKVNNYKN